MIAFTIFGWPVYRYGIFYLITFIYGYLFLLWLGKKSYFSSFPSVQHFLTKGLDDLVIVILLGVIIGGRLGHVLIYDLQYYMQHLGEIIRIDQGGMSFIGGVCGVICGLAYLFYKKHMRIVDFLVLGDIILCVVPVGIFLGRIGNYLNQELWGKPLASLSSSYKHLFTTLGLTHVYDAVDPVRRVNTNFMQSFGEGLLPLLVTNSILFLKYCAGKIRPGLISGVFLLIYGVVRFIIEFFKDLPYNEYIGPLSVSQRIMLVFIALGVTLVFFYSPSDK